VRALKLQETMMNALAKTLTITEFSSQRKIDIIRVEANLGAEIIGLDLASPLTPAVADTIRGLLWEHQVLFFRDTGLDNAGQAALGRIFGEPDVDSIAERKGQKPDDIVPMNTGPYSNSYYGTKWHADATYREYPYQVSILRSVIAPELGGDTVYSSGISAYESLPQEVKARIADLTAIHRPDSKAKILIKDDDELSDYLREYNGVEHPVVITHPFNGKKVLYVNETFTHEIVGLPREESDDLLRYLTHQFYRPENQVRFKWRPGSLAIWDNRAVQHYGVADYGNAQRQLVRVVSKGDRPVR
jgi:alpha-ketoglutarate-dependent taurine dioxygenase